MAQSNQLRALIQRLTSTPVEELPSIAYFLASSISRCLVGPQVPGVDKSALLHKLKARVSSLLQDRAAEGRFAAVVVAKAVIEAGGRDILVDSEPWIRGLIGILSKADSVATKRLAILTISRAFVLAQEYPSIVRVVTTPLLPSFNTACLAAIRPRTAKTVKGTQNILSPLLRTALQCWIQLLPQHPATFRPFITRFRPICLSLLSDANTPASISVDAGALLVTLHYSAPKNAALSEWSQLCQEIIRAAHATAVQLFRSVREEWTPVDSDISQAPEPVHPNGELPSAGPDVLGLAKWKGMHDGAQRLSRLFDLLRTSMSATTATEVPVPLSGIMDLCARVLTLTIPGVGKDSPYTLKASSEFGKDEREMLWSELPAVHISCLKLLRAIVGQFQDAILPISKSIIDQLTWLFGAEQDLPDVRECSYELLELLLPIVGTTGTHADVKNVSDIVRLACKDLSPPTKIAENTVGNEKGTEVATTNVDSFASSTKTNAGLAKLAHHTTMQAKASRLISTFLQHVPAHIIPNNLRTDIDRTIILTQERRALLASVLNPAAVQQGKLAPASLLPFLAHTAVGLEAEALLRPRTGVIVDKKTLDIDQDLAESDAGEANGTLTGTGNNGLLDRLDKALETSGPAEALDENEEPEKVPKSISVDGDLTLSATIKRNFAAMNGNGLNDWHTADSSTLSIEETNAKKARTEEQGLAALLWGDEGVAAGQTSIEAVAGTDAGHTEAVIMQSKARKTDSQGQPHDEVDIQPIVKSVSKGKEYAINDDDSDSDIPEINIDPDTDEEEDEDEDMYG